MPNIAEVNGGTQHARPIVTNGQLGAVGNTPLIRLNKLSDKYGCEILGKAEFMNPGGRTGSAMTDWKVRSVKDRPALHMILDAEEKGTLKPGGTVYEATSGNTGIGLAHVCNARGYKLKVVMPRTMSQEKQATLRQLGCDLILSEPQPLRNPETGEPNMGHYHNLAPQLAKEAQERGENAVCVNQWHNTANRTTHYLTTGPEIVKQTEGKLDAFVAATGTGGTIGGVSRYLKEHSPQTKVVLLDCYGSALFGWASTGNEGDIEVFNGGEICKKPPMGSGSSPMTEGIGNSIITKNMEGLLDYIDEANQVHDDDVLEMLFYLLHEEGVFVGGSAALNVCGAVEQAKKLGPGHTIVTVLCDSGSRYSSKIFNRTWLEEKGLWEKIPAKYQSTIDPSVKA